MKLATLCYLQKDGKTLMLLRKKDGDMHKGTYVGLGGKFEPGERAEDCVIREVAEESGLIIEKPALRGFVLFDNSERTFSEGKKEEDWYVFVYVANHFKGEQTECSDGMLGWILDSEVENLKMWPGDRLILKWVRENKGIFSAKLKYREYDLASHDVDFYK